ncbi:MAG: ketopantoate reductase family protein [Faecousia sp.]
MKILVYGAGVIGCFLAHTLCDAGQEVTLLARGEWKDTLEQQGLTIHHSLQRKRTVDHPRIVETPGDQRFDAVFAVMQHQQMKAILPELAQLHTPLLVCVGNNLSAPEMEQAILAQSKEEKTVLFGFQGTGGRRENGQVECVRFGDGSMSIGGLHGEADEKIREQISSLFRGTRYRLTWVPDMDAWYRCHLTLVLPASYLCYTTGCDLRKATSVQRRTLLDAAGEAYGLLKALGYPIYPEGEDAYYQPGSKRAFMTAMMFVMAKTKIGDLAASDHCRHAVTEMEGLDAAWEEMRRRMPDHPMPAWDQLRREKPDWNTLHRLYEKA